MRTTFWTPLTYLCKKRAQLAQLRCKTYFLSYKNVIMMYIGYWKGIVHPKFKDLALFIHANFTPNLNDCISQRKNCENFYFILFCFVLFCFVLFCFVLFCFILFYFILFCFVLFYLFYFILFYFILFYFILFYFILFYFILFCFILFYFVLQEYADHSFHNKNKS